MVNKANIQLYTEIPESASNIWVNFSACILFFLTLGLAIRLHIFSQMPERVLFALIITVLPLIVWDLYFQNKNIVRELESEADKVSINTGRVSVKLIGFYVTIFSVLLMYHFTPLYYQSQNALDFYSPFLILLTNFLPYLIPLSMIYFCYMDRKQKDPYDEY